MRNIIVSMRVTLDGFIAGPNGEMDWMEEFIDESLANYESELQKTVDVTLFGRVTYQGFESFWPQVARDPASPKGLVEYAQQLNAMRKIVFSKTLSRAEWNNAALVKEIVPEEIIHMKQEPGRDMVIYGSASIVRTRTNLCLIDRYHLVVYPVVARERQASLSRHRAHGEAFACQHQDTPFRGRGTLLPADKVFPALMPANSGLACMLFSVSTRLNRRSTR